MQNHRSLFLSATIGNDNFKEGSVTAQTMVFDPNQKAWIIVNQYRPAEELPLEQISRVGPIPTLNNSSITTFGQWYQISWAIEFGTIFAYIVRQTQNDVLVYRGAKILIADEAGDMISVSHPTTPHKGRRFETIGLTVRGAVLKPEEIARLTGPLPTLLLRDVLNEHEKQRMKVEILSKSRVSRTSVRNDKVALVDESGKTRLVDVQVASKKRLLDI